VIDRGDQRRGGWTGGDPDEDHGRSAWTAIGRPVRTAEPAAWGSQSKVVGTEPTVGCRAAGSRGGLPGAWTCRPRGPRHDDDGDRPRSAPTASRGCASSVPADQLHVERLGRQRAEGPPTRRRGGVGHR
jgi:hypothetical protein